MSLKVKLISTISAFILVLSMFFVGVFAAQNVELNVGGSVSFTATSVYAQITGSYVGTAEHPSQAQSLTPIDIDAETTDGAVDMPDDWTNMPLNFDASGSEITVTISIKNLATDRAIAVSLTDNTSITGVNIAREYNSSSISDSSITQKIAGGQTGTFTFTLSLTSKNNDISDAFDLDLDLKSVITNNVTLNVTYSEYFDKGEGKFYYSVNGEEKIQTTSTQIILNNVSNIQFFVEGNSQGATLDGVVVTFFPTIYQEKEYEFEINGHSGSTMSDVYDIDCDVTINVNIQFDTTNPGGGIVVPEL